MRYVRTIFDNSIVNETSPEDNWNRQTGGQAGRQTGAQVYLLSQADYKSERVFLVAKVKSLS